MGLYRVICCAVRNTVEDFRNITTRTDLHNSPSFRNESRDTLICGQAVLWRGGRGGVVVWFISESWRNVTSTWPVASIICVAENNHPIKEQFFFFCILWVSMETDRKLSFRTLIKRIYSVSAIFYIYLSFFLYSVISFLFTLITFGSILAGRG